MIRSLSGSYQGSPCRVLENWRHFKSSRPELQRPGWRLRTIVLELRHNGRQHRARRTKLEGCPSPILVNRADPSARVPDPSLLGVFYFMLSPLTTFVSYYNAFADTGEHYLCSPPFDQGFASDRMYLPKCSLVLSYKWKVSRAIYHTSPTLIRG